MDDFTATISTFFDDALRTAEHDRQAVVMGVGDALIDRTPVGEPDTWKDTRWKDYALEHGYVGGHMKANWQTAVGSPIDTELTDNGKPFDGPADVSGALAKDAVRSNLGSGDCTVFITNNVPYCERIEEGSLSPQAPSGVVAPVMADVENIIREAVAL